MADKQQSLNSLLEWSIKNSATAAPEETAAAPAATEPRDASRGLNAAMLAELLGGPSDADLMRESMTAIVAPPEDVTLENKLVAFDNLEQLIEQIDNANNMEPLGLWPPLLQQLDHPEADMRRMAAWCISTAVQNNIKSQERLVAHDGIPRLARLATEDDAAPVRKKAITALSSAVRNFQQGLEQLEASLPSAVWTQRVPALDAADMDAVDEIIQTLRDHSASKS